MWMTLRQYAEKEKISVQSARLRAKNRKVESKKVKGQVYVDDGTPDKETAVPAEESADLTYRQSLEKRWDVDNELKRQKILNIQADVILKKQKAVAYREKLRVEFCEGVLEAYTDAFGDLKAVLVDMRMGKEQIRKFRDTYGKCLKKFERRLSEFIRQKDAEEEKENDDGGGVNG